MLFSSFGKSFVNSNLYAIMARPAENFGRGEGKGKSQRRAVSRVRAAAKRWPCRTTARNLAMVLLLSVIAGCDTGPDSGEYVRRAEEHRQRGELGAAELELKNALRAEPGNAHLRLQLARLYLLLNNGHAAFKELERAEALGLERGDLIVPRTEALFQLRAYRRLLDETRGAVSEGDEDLRVRLLVLRARALVAQGNPRLARLEYDRALALRPDDVEALIGMLRLSMDERDPSAAKGYLRRIEAILDADDLRRWRLRGELELRLRHYRNAEEAFRRALALDPDDSDALSGAAWALFLRSRIDAAQALVARIRGPARYRPSAALLIGALAYQAGRYTEAQEYLARVVKVWPDHLHANLMLAASALVSGELEQAEAVARRVAARDPDSSEALLLLGAVYLKRGESARTVELLEPTLSVSADDRRLLGLIGAAFLRDGDYRSARNALGRAGELGIGPIRLKAKMAAESLRRHDAKAARQALDGPLGTVDDGPPAQFEAVQYLLREKRLGEALEQAQRLARQFPGNPTPYSLIGKINLALGDLDAARDYYRQALAIEPRYDPAALTLARIAEAQGDFGQAAYYYEQVLNVRPGHGPAALAVARLELRAGHPLAAVAVLRSALDARPDSLPIGVALTRVLANQDRSEEAEGVLGRLRIVHPDHPELAAVEGWLALKEQRYAQALTAFRSARQHAPSDSRALMADFARAQWRSGDADGAVATLETWVKAHPEDEDARMALAGQAMRLGRREQAKAGFEQILRQSPEHVLALNDMAWLLVEEAPAQALAYARRAHALAPRLPFVADTLGWVLLERGEPGEAEPLFRDALTAIPNHPTYRVHLALALAENGKREEARRVLGPLVEDPRRLAQYPRVREALEQGP